MPEGDSIHGVARRMDTRLTGHTLTRVGGSDPSVRHHAARLRGATVERVEAIGKHLIVEFEGGWALRVHLGMSGRWRFGPPTGVRGDGPARVALETSRWAARCYGPPTVEVDRTPIVWDHVDHLGPDLTADDPDIDEALDRAFDQDPTRTISEILLDQRIASGIGNVYRNEILFEAGVHPEAPMAEVDEEQLAWMYDRASKHLQANVGRHRTTTGGRKTGTETYVYNRSGRPCRRCGATIQEGRSTDQQRQTYWCPGCQPPAGSRTEH